MSANLTAQPIDQLLEQFLAIALAQDLAERKANMLSTTGFTGVWKR